MYQMSSVPFGPLSGPGGASFRLAGFRLAGDFLEGTGAEVGAFALGGLHGCHEPDFPSAETTYCSSSSMNS